MTETPPWLVLPLQCMFDTNVFDRILDGPLPLAAMIGKVIAHATHVQSDEIDKIPDAKADRRAALRELFKDVVSKREPTESFAVGTSRVGETRIAGDRVVPTSTGFYGASYYGQACYSGKDSLFEPIKTELDKIKVKPNNGNDALIAETAIKGGYILVTDDEDLQTVTRQFTDRCLSVEQLLEELA